LWNSSFYLFIVQQFLWAKCTLKSCNFFRFRQGFYVYVLAHSEPKNVFLAWSQFMQTEKYSIIILLIAHYKLYNTIVGMVHSVPRIVAHVCKCAFPYFQARFWDPQSLAHAIVTMLLLFYSNRGSIQKIGRIFVK